MTFTVRIAIVSHETVFCFFSILSTYFYLSDSTAKFIVCVLMFTVIDNVFSHSPFGFVGLVYGPFAKRSFDRCSLFTKLRVRLNTENIEFF